MLVLEVWGLTRDSVPVLFLLSGQRVPSRMNLLDLELSGAQFGIVLLKFSWMFRASSRSFWIPGQFALP